MTYTAQGQRNSIRAFRVMIGNARQCIASAQMFIRSASERARDMAEGDLEQDAIEASITLKGTLALLRELEALAPKEQRRRR